MKLTKTQIRSIQSALEKTINAKIRLEGAVGNLAKKITEATGIDGYVDALSGDGLGFTPASESLSHIPIEEIIDMGEKGIDITEDEISRRLSF